MSYFEDQNYYPHLCLPHFFHLSQYSTLSSVYLTLNVCLMAFQLFNPANKSLGLVHTYNYKFSVFHMYSKFDIQQHYIYFLSLSKKLNYNCHNYLVFQFLASTYNPLHTNSSEDLSINDATIGIQCSPGTEVIHVC